MIGMAEDVHPLTIKLHGGCIKTPFFLVWNMLINYIIL